MTYTWETDVDRAVFDILSEYNDGAVRFDEYVQSKFDDLNASGSYTQETINFVVFDLGLEKGALSIATGIGSYGQQGIDSYKSSYIDYRNAGLDYEASIIKSGIRTNLEMTLEVSADILNPTVVAKKIYNLTGGTPSSAISAMPGIGSLLVAGEYFSSNTNQQVLLDAENLFKENVLVPFWELVTGQTATEAQKNALLSRDNSVLVGYYNDSLDFMADAIMNAYENAPEALAEIEKIIGLKVSSGENIGAKIEEGLGITTPDPINDSLKARSEILDGTSKSYVYSNLDNFLVNGFNGYDMNVNMAYVATGGNLDQFIPAMSTLYSPVPITNMTPINTIQLTSKVAGAEQVVAEAYPTGQTLSSTADVVINLSADTNIKNVTINSENLTNQEFAIRLESNGGLLGTGSVLTDTNETQYFYGFDDDYESDIQGKRTIKTVFESEGIYFDSDNALHTFSLANNKTAVLVDSNAAVNDSNGNSFLFSGASKFMSDRIGATANFLSENIGEILSYTEEVITPQKLISMGSTIGQRVAAGDDIEDIAAEVATNVLVEASTRKFYHDILETDITMVTEYAHAAYDHGGSNIVTRNSDGSWSVAPSDGVGPTLEVSKYDMLDGLTNQYIVAGITAFTTSMILNGDAGDAARDTVSALGATKVQELLAGGENPLIGSGPAAAAAVAAIMVMATDLINGDFGEETLGQAAIASGVAFTSSFIATAVTGVQVTMSSVFSALGAATLGIGLIVGFVMGKAIAKILEPTVHHDETISHSTEEQPDGSLLITGLREEGSLLRTSTTDDDVYAGTGDDVVVGATGQNELYGEAGDDFIEGRDNDDYIEGGIGDDHIEAGDQNDYADGGTGNDRVYGGAGDDNVLGGDGEDIVLGGAGNDQVEGNADNDRLYGGSGEDTILGGTGDDIIEGGDDRDILSGEDGDDTIDGGAGDDDIRGDDGNDYLYGDAGNDDVRGGLGDDYIFGEAGVDTLYGNAGNDTMDGGVESDLLFGGIGNDTLAGGYGNDDIYGEIGNDLLVGGKGDDLLDGGSDDDVFLFTKGDGHDTIDDDEGLNTLKFTDINSADVASVNQAGNDLVITIDTENSITVQNHFITSGLEYIEFADGQAIHVPDIAYDGGGNGAYVLVAGQNVLNVFADQYSRYQLISNPFTSTTALTTGWLQDNYDLSVTTEAYDRELYNDIQVRMWEKSSGVFNMKKSMGFYDYYERNLRGTGDRDRIVDLFSSATINGSANDDQLYGNGGADIIHGGLDADLIYGGADADNLYGEDGTDKVFGGTGNDNIYGGIGNDTLFGEWGADNISGDEGEDYISGGQDNDTIDGGAGRDIIYGDEGNDNISGGTGEDYLNGGLGDDTLQGNDGNDLLFGGEGNDNLQGGAGEDILIGDAGTDIIDGGADEDTVVLSGNLSDYSVEFNLDDTVTITDVRVNAFDGISTLTNVEKVQFADQTVSLWELFPEIGNITIAQGQTFNGDLGLPAGYSAVVDTAPVAGTFVLNVNGTYSYTAPNDFSGNTSFKYRLTTPDGITMIKNVDVEIPAVAAGSGAYTLDNEFEVSPYTYVSVWANDNERMATRMAKLNDGGYVITWSSGLDGSSLGVYAQRYDLNDNKVGGVFRVNTETYMEQDMAEVIGLADGGFLITWSDYLHSGDDHFGTYMQRYDVNGNKVGGETRVNIQTAGAQAYSDVAILNNGEMVITWTSQQTSSLFDIYARRFSSTGAAIGGEFKVTTNSNGHKYGPEIVALENGGYVVVWEDWGSQDGSGYGVYGQAFNSSSQKIGAEFRANTYIGSHQYEPQVAALTGGDFVVAWSSNGQDGSGYGVYAQKFNSSGSKLNAEFRVNTYTASNQMTPYIIGLSDGGFFVTWQSNGQDGSQYGIYSQRYDADGVTVGGEIRLNDVNANNQYHPSVVELDNGDLVVSWQSWDNTSQPRVVARRLIAPAASNEGMTVTGTSESDIMVGDAGGDTFGGSNGDDTFDGKGGDDIIDGGIGIDTASYHGNAADYNILIDGDQISVTDTRGGSPDGSDTLTAIEKLSFADKDIDLRNLFPEISDMTITQGEQYSDALTLPAGYTVAIDTAPTVGSFTLNPDGSYSFTSPVSYAGDISFKYSITTPDGIKKVDEAIVTVPTAPGGDSPYTADNEFQAGTYNLLNNNWEDHLERHAVKTARLNDGGYIAIWASNSDGSGHGIYGQRFDANDVKVGLSFLINTTTSGYQYMPDVVALNDGGFTVTWSQWQGAALEHDIYMQRYNSSSNKIGGEKRLNNFTSTHQAYSKLIILDNGEMVATWTSQQNSSSYEIYANRFDLNGNALSNEFKVNTYDAGHQFEPQITKLANGNYVIAWEDQNGQDGSDYGVYAQVFNSSSTKIGSEFRINTYTNAKQWKPSLAALNGGGFVSVWESDGQDGSSLGIYGQRFDDSGNKVGSEFSVNAYTASWQAEADVISLAGGGFVVTWQSNGQDGNENAIVAQRFDANGNKLYSEFIVNQVGTGNQVTPDVLEMVNGDLIFLWQTWANSGTKEVMGRRFRTEAGGYVFAGDLNANIFVGGDENDQISGGEGDDILVGDAGDDLIDGGVGTDASVYAGNFADYTITLNNDTITITDNRAGSPDGTDTLDNIEILKFADTEVTIEGLFPEISDIITVQGEQLLGDLNLSAGFTTAIEEAPTQGTLVLNVDGTYSYTSPAGYSGNVSFKYSVTSPDGIVRIADVNINVVPEAASSIAFTQGNENTVADYVYQHVWTDTPERESSKVAKLSNGDHVIVWSTHEGSGHVVYGQRYNSSNNKIGSVFRISPTGTVHQYMQDVVGLNDGGFAVTWTDYVTGTDQHNVRMSIYNSAGIATVSNVLLDDGVVDNEVYSKVTLLNDGNLAFAWAGQNPVPEYNIFTRIYNTSGTATTSVTQVATGSGGNQEMRFPEITALTNGKYVVTWENTDATNGKEVEAQIMNANGTLSGSKISVNTNLGDDQYEVSVAALNNGGFVILWTSENQDGDGSGVYGQKYDSAGQKVGVEFVINANTSGNQVNADVTSLADGGFYAVWSSYGQDGSGAGIHGQRYDASGNTVGDETAINTITTNDQFYPFVDEMTNGDLVVSWQSLHDTTRKVMSKRLTATAEGGYMLNGNTIDENIVGSDLADEIAGSSGNDIIVGGLGDDTLTGNSGNDIYRFNEGDGSDTINNQDSDGFDTLEFGADVEVHEVWFRQFGYDLKVDLLNSDDSVIFENWFTSDAQRVDEFTLDDGQALDKNNVDQLISAMAGFNPDAFGAVNSVNDLPDSVKNTIVATWT